MYFSMKLSLSYYGNQTAIGKSSTDQDLMIQYFSTPIALITNEIMVRYLPKIDFERKTTKLSCIFEYSMLKTNIPLCY